MKLRSLIRVIFFFVFWFFVVVFLFFYSWFRKKVINHVVAVFVFRKNQKTNTYRHIYTQTENNDKRKSVFYNLPVRTVCTVNELKHYTQDLHQIKPVICKSNNKRNIIESKIKEHICKLVTQSEIQQPPTHKPSKCPFFTQKPLRVFWNLLPHR